MKQKIQLSTILALFISLSIFAQEIEQPIDLTGKWALQFQIDHYFTLDDFQGGTFSGKYHLSNSSAFRLGVSYSSETDEQDEKQTLKFSDETETVNKNDIREYDVIGFNLQYLYYTKIVNSISMFLGAGVNYETSLSNRKGTTTREDFTGTDIYETSYSGYGIDLLIGVEWFVRSNIGISAEYGSKYRSIEYEGTDSYSSGDESISVDYEGTESGFEYDRVKFGVSIYF